VLKITRGVHEVITTIMLNSVIIAITDWLASDPWRSPRAAFPKTPDIRSTAEIPRIDAIPLGFVLAVAVALLIAWVFRRTTVGFEVTTVGANRDAAHYAGISVNRMILLAMGLSGFLAGVGGAVETLGVLGHYEQGSSPTLGFDGITIALLARLNARATIPAALLIGAMRASDTKLQSEAGVAPDIVSVIVAVILLFVAAPALVRWLLRMKGGEGEPQIQLTTGWGG
jgi:simple sugar transport system permease protein